MNSWTDRTTARHRLPTGWDNSDDEDDLEDRHPDEYGGPEGDDDRALAALRGAIAGSKKVPSKSAIASLEVVKPEDLKEADKSKFPFFIVLCHPVLRHIKWLYFTLLRGSLEASLFFLHSTFNLSRLYRFTDYK